MRSRILCVFSYLLGGQTISRQIQVALEDSYDLTIIPLDASAYQRRRPTLFARLQDSINWFTGARLVKSDVEKVDPSTFDLVLIQSFDLMPAVEVFLLNVPIIVFHDATGHLAREMTRRRKSALRSAATDLLFPFRSRIEQRCVQRVSHFFPRTEWCAASLRDFYGVPDKKISILPGGIDLGEWSDDNTVLLKTSKQITCLFVGNDFSRKGGPMILECFSSRALQDCKLIVVTNDSSIDSFSLPPNVEHISGITHENKVDLIDIFHSADLFLFPTFEEMMGVVLTEAAASGLPIIASNTGGVSQIVRQGVNGELLDQYSGTEVWVSAIRRLVDDPELRAKYSSASRRLADEEFSLPVMKNKLLSVIQDLLNIDRN